VIAVKSDHNNSMKKDVAESNPLGSRFIFKILLFAGLSVSFNFIATAVSDSAFEKFKKTTAELEIKANAGDAEAQCKYAMFLMAPYEDEKDPVKKEIYLNKIISYMKQSADQKNPTAQAVLGRWLSLGRILKKDQAKAIKLWKLSAEKGDPLGQYYLASALDKGQGLPQDRSKAFDWYLKSGEQGFVEAELALGFAYSLGQGVRKDAEKALEWFIRAAKQGDETAKKCVDLINESKSSSAVNKEKDDGGWKLTGVNVGGPNKPFYSTDGTLKGYINNKGRIYDENMDYKGWIGK
jgi:TPR repeat protein